MRSGSLWLASYPRSGNTLLRMILRSAFGIGSRSVYNERSLPMPTRTLFGDGLAVKTHALSTAGPAIYVVRDGREVCVSLWHYMRQCMGVSCSMKDVILGRHRFGRWCDHLNSWNPRKRPDTLLVHYESLTEPQTLERIGDFLGVDPQTPQLPPFDELRANDPQMFRAGTNDTWRDELTDLDLFYEVNGEAMERYGYAARKAVA